MLTRTEPESRSRAPVTAVLRVSEYSMQLNASRIKVLQAQDDLVSAMREAASKDLLNVSHHKFQHHHNYEGLMKYLIVQGLLRLKEPSVLLRCRKEDVNIVHSVLDAAKAEYAEKTHVHEPKIIVDSIHLPPGPSHNDPHALSCSGGVVLASRDGKIVFENNTWPHHYLLLMADELRMGIWTWNGRNVLQKNEPHLKQLGFFNYSFFF
ncbi:hypothetical protein R6Q59_014928 [Mikania micrantha]